jgi:Uma2 family endonuclease
MDAKVVMSVEEYLGAAWDGADRDYVDGEVVERNMGELPHARLKAELFLQLSNAAKGHSLQVLPEVRIQVSATRFRVADIAVWRPGSIGTRVPTVAPFLVVEILSPEDRLVRLQPKVQDYLSHGVEWVWAVDPDERRALSYSPSSPGGALVSVLRTDHPALAVPLKDVLCALDE